MVHIFNLSTAKSSLSILIPYYGSIYCRYIKIGPKYRRVFCIIMILSLSFFICSSLFLAAYFIALFFFDYLLKQTTEDYGRAVICLGK